MTTRHVALFQCPTCGTVDDLEHIGREANRLTADDRDRIRANVRTFAVATPAMNAAERSTTAERIAHRAIGCDERDLRICELAEILEIVAPILAAHPSAPPR